MTRDASAADAAYEYLKKNAHLLTPRGWLRDAIAFEMRHNAQWAEEEGNFWITDALAGDSHADFTLREIAKVLLEDGRPLPETLAGYIIAIIDGDAPKRKPARKKETFGMRNNCIAGAVRLMKRFGLKPTRNEASRGRHESGCSIVALALRRLANESDNKAYLNEKGAVFSEAGVQEIWKEKGKI